LCVFNQDTTDKPPVVSKPVIKPRTNKPEMLKDVTPQVETKEEEVYLKVYPHLIHYLDSNPAHLSKAEN